MQKEELMNIYSATEAADYLGLDVIEFSQYEVKSRLCYQLIKGRRMYSEKELLRFRREVLDHV
jgi:hypothetical protein